MEPHQDRVVKERYELNEKIEKLDAFTKGETFKGVDEKEQARLLKQLDIMRQYSAILAERIEAFV